MSYVALYRKFRPDNFADVKGQDHIVTTLKNQILSGRVGHAYLFCGTRGTGKTTMAKLMAKAVNCENPKDGNPCGECPACKSIAAGANMSVAEIDAASNNGVDNVREIIDEVAFPPADAKYRVYIIDEVHMLSPGAFNALLKTLEEPPSYCLFILATTDPQKLPITILSRCQRYDFKRITVDVIADRLEELTSVENVDVEPRALRYIAKVADGSMRDALSLLDQCLAFHYGKKLEYDMVLNVLGAVDTEVFSRLYRSVLALDVIGCLKILDEVVAQGRELGQFVTDLIDYLRNLLIVKSSDDPWSILDVSDENRARLMEEADMSDLQAIIRYIKIFSRLLNEIRYSASKRLLVETALIKLCKPEMETDYEALLDRIRVLEEKMEKGMGPMVMPVTGAAMTMAAGGISTVLQEEKVELPAALPEDIQAVADHWSTIVSRSPDGAVRSMLKNAYPSITPDNKLKIVTKDSMNGMRLKTDESRENIKSAMRNFIGKEVDFVVEVAAADGSEDHKNPSILSQIKMEVTTENTEESDYV